MEALATFTVCLTDRQADRSKDQVLKQHYFSLKLFCRIGPVHKFIIKNSRTCLLVVHGIDELRQIKLIGLLQLALHSYSYIFKICMVDSTKIKRR